MSLSTQPCDFRGFTPGGNSFPSPDPTGVNRQLGWGGGNAPNINFMLTEDLGIAPKLQPGQTYFLNLRTLHFSNGNPSCTNLTCNVLMTLNPPK